MDLKFPKLQNHPLKEGKELPEEIKEGFELSKEGVKEAKKFSLPEVEKSRDDERPSVLIPVETEPPQSSMPVIHNEEILGSGRLRLQSDMLLRNAEEHEHDTIEIKIDPR